MLWILGFHPKDLRPFRSGDIDFPICEYYCEAWHCEDCLLLLMEWKWLWHLFSRSWLCHLPYQFQMQQLVSMTSRIWIFSGPAFLISVTLRLPLVEQINIGFMSARVFTMSPPKQKEKKSSVKLQRCCCLSSPFTQINLFRKYLLQYRSDLLCFQLCIIQWSCNVSMTLTDPLNSYVLNAAQICHFGIHLHFKALLMHVINI